MSEKKQVNFRVRKDRKEQWETAMENSTKYESLTHLITHSVEQELKGDDRSPSANVATNATAETIETDVVPPLEQIQRGLSALEERLNRIETEMQTGGAYDIEQAILDFLPALADPNYWQPSDGMTAEEVHETLQSRGINVDRTTVRETLDGLANTTGLVVRDESADPTETRFATKE